MSRTRDDWRGCWYKALFDSKGGQAEILDFELLYWHAGDSRAMRRQFPNGGDFWLVYTDTDPATHSPEQIASNSRDSGVVLIRTTMRTRWLLPNRLNNVGYVVYSHGSVEKTPSRPTWTTRLFR